MVSSELDDMVDAENIVHINKTVLHLSYEVFMRYVFKLYACFIECGLHSSLSLRFVRGWYANRTDQASGGELTAFVRHFSFVRLD
jgi:hypothetical protein